MKDTLPETGKGSPSWKDFMIPKFSSASKEKLIGLEAFLKKGENNKDTASICQPQTDSKTVNSVEPEVAPEDEEAEALEHNCSYFRDFIKDLKSRGDKGMSSQSKKIIKNMKKEMGEFLNSDECLPKSEVVAEKLKFSSEPLGDTTKGAISKTRSSRKSVEKDSSLSENSDGSSISSPSDVTGSEDSQKESSDDDDLVADSKAKPTPDKRKHKTKKHNKHNKQNKDCNNNKHTTSDEDKFALFLKRLDNRSIPKQEPFHDEAGQDLNRYLVRFEEYCTNTFKGNRYLWIVELERNLQGRVLEGFRSLRDYEDDYEDVKSKLLTWYTNNKELRRKKAKKRFQNARPKPKESMYLFSTRLEGLYKLAFPKHDITQSKTLLNQFKKVV